MKEFEKFLKGGQKWEQAHMQKMQQTKYMKRLQNALMQPDF